MTCRRGKKSESLIDPERFRIHRTESNTFSKAEATENSIVVLRPRILEPLDDARCHGENSKHTRGSGESTHNDRRLLIYGSGLELLVFEPFSFREFVPSECVLYFREGNDVVTSSFVPTLMEANLSREIYMIPLHGVVTRTPLFEIGTTENDYDVEVNG